MEKIALITGITGQDGSYLAEFLLEKGYYVWGIVRRCSNLNTQRIDHIYNNERLILKYGDMTDHVCLISILHEIKNTYSDLKILEVYNLAAQSHVKVSFEIPHYSAQVDAIGTLNLLESIRTTGLIDKTRFYQASTSELYGKVLESPQNENTPFNPQSPYAIAKLYSYWITRNYRDAYKMFASNGICFNHESERRGVTFVTRKITIGVGKIVRGEIDKITLGNIDSERDWGHAKDFIRVMWLILQHDSSDDFVIATGEKHTVREFIEKAFLVGGITIEWKGSGIDEVGINSENGKIVVDISEKYFRPTEVNTLLGDYSKLKKEVGWSPDIIFEELVKKMVDHDM